MGRFTRYHRLGCMVVIAATAGCYSYRSLPVDQVQTGTQVRTRVSPTRAEQLSTLLNREDRVIEGRVLQAAPDQLMLEVPIVSSGPAMTERLHQRIQLARPDLVEIEVRQLDRLRTGLFVGALVSGATALIITQFVDNGPDIDGPGKGGIERALVPVFTIRF